MTASVRRAIPSDVHGVVELIHAYANEVFTQAASVTTEALLNDGFGDVLEFLVADLPNGELVGFAAWEKTYDVVAGARGGTLLALFVRAEIRQQGVGQTLLSAVMREVRAIGGSFVTGVADQPVELTETRRSSLLAPRLHDSATAHDAADLAAKKSG